MKPLFKQLFLSVIFIILNSYAEAQQKGDPPTLKEFVVGAFQITRTDLIARIVSSDSLMVFKACGELNGLPNYIGEDKHNARIQLVGVEKDLQTARFTFTFTTDPNINKLQFQRMSYFVFTVVGKSGLVWFYEKSEKFVKNLIESFNERKDFESVKAELKYDVTEKAMSITFDKE